MTASAQTEINCPFYGHWFMLHFYAAGPAPRFRMRFMPAKSPLCALFLSGARRCDQHNPDQPGDWRRCPVWQQAELTGFGDA
jgi:hypothetical protein